MAAASKIARCKEEGNYGCATTGDDVVVVVVIVVVVEVGEDDGKGLRLTVARVVVAPFCR